MPSYVSHLECSLTEERFEACSIRTVSEAGKPLLVKYDLERLGREICRNDIERSEDPGFWRYWPLLPVGNPVNRISLGEVVTPLIPMKGTAKEFGWNPDVLIVKDESRLPTGSFKARGLGLAVSMAKELGIEHLAIPTNGNAGSALAAYSARAGIKSTVLCPDNTPIINVRESSIQGANTFRVNGLIGECGEIITNGKDDLGWFAVSTLKEPYRIEGKKTMGLELAEQMKWSLPDVIFYPTGGGTGIIGMWKAFHEMRELGWIDCRFPKMIAVQSTGCAPIVRAWDEGKEFAEYWENAETISSGIRVPSALGDFLILRTVRDSGGFAIAVSDEETLEMQERAGVCDGVLLCPEGAALMAAYRNSLESGLIGSDEVAVLFNTATGLKYPMPEVEGRIDRLDFEYQIFSN